MASYKLIYFNLKGRAEVIRTLFALSGVEFEEVRLAFEDWPVAKQKLPFLQAPVLEVTENSKTVQIAQSASIVRYLANKFGLAGKNEIESAQADMIHEQITDLFNKLVAIYIKKESEEKRQELDAAMKETVPAGLKLIQNLLEKNENGNGFLVGNSLTYVDVSLVNFYDWLRESKGEVLSKLEALKQHHEKITKLPVIAQHLKQNEGVRLTILFPN